jgi:TetR/AcrR family transcriptional regulator, regulator of autoinduction and epiphytic fitness
MSDGVKRRYRSPQRREQANATRREIMEAAQRLFSADGYGRTSMEAVASAADVSVATVYLTFRSKLGLLSALVEDVTADRSLDVQQVLAEADVDGQVTVGVRIIRQLHERTASISGILRAGYGNDPGLEALWDEWQARHLAAVSQVAQHLGAAGRLRPGVDVAWATDVLYTMSGSETYRQLVFDRGWSPDQFEEWLAASARRLVLAEV